MSTTEPPATPPAQKQTVSTNSVDAHTHEITAEERAVVVGKCVKRATAANEVVDVLVDIAG